MQYDKSRKSKAELVRKHLGEATIICGAIKKDTGKICTAAPVEGSKRCAIHGGYSTGPATEEGKQRALANLSPQANMIHGIYSRFVFTTEESDFYAYMMSAYEEAYDLDLANLMLLDRALRNFILNQRKEIALAGEQVDESNSYNDYDTKFLRYMQALGFDRKFNMSKENKNNKGDNTVVLNQLFDFGDDN
ncbi:hypothetical protein FBHYGVHD_CDS0109 [Staphylococcus phage MVC_VPHSA1]|uniref:Terminase small subunit n=1 Tax=Staphylococcus phage MVC_VPHSA1 TaxID=3088876 RepID=A0ABZ0QYT8_9CAUD|nr:hypothetical protein FBHYGVHD_CDS0002 [Staphylococcus phage MVC_VPHSA1]WPF64956.1 hypothetical protein FBHYGVHD_CDS0109 [Staphylococcus phage MVC_VPHSA1]